MGKASQAEVQNLIGAGLEVGALHMMMMTDDDDGDDD
jgi:hypothetical protein